jgi:diaminopimelate decarboxylase/aspartate kinase
MSQEFNEAPFVESDMLGAPEPIANSDLVVMKFGGTTVSRADNWQKISSLLKNRLDSGLRPVVVHSAIAKVTSDLEEILEVAVNEDPVAQLEALRQQHYVLAQDLGVDGPALLDDSLQEIERLVAGIRLVREVSPRIHAHVVGLGELMATALSAAFLRKSGFDVFLQDARDILIAEDRVDRSLAQNYVSATCSYDVDPELKRDLQKKGEVILTQGFIARNHQNETVLLGREGSDTSGLAWPRRVRHVGGVSRGNPAGTQIGNLDRCAGYFHGRSAAGSLGTLAHRIAVRRSAGTRFQRQQGIASALPGTAS